MICALVLAAGESRRMGTPKLLLPFGGKTIIEHIVDNINQSKADKILLVLGSHREEILSKMADRPVLIVVNHRYKEGMLSHTPPAGELVPGKSYTWRVRVADSSDWVEVQNIAWSEWLNFTMAQTLK